MPASCTPCEVTTAGADVDAIVVGAGHNGLTCAGYLARAGVKVTVLEGRATVGGCASTVDACGARVNLCNCDHTMILSTQIREELDLARYGLRYLNVDPMLLSISWAGDHPWFLFRDPERTVAALARSYPTEVAAYRRYLDLALPAARLLLSISADLPTPRRLAVALARERGRGARTVHQWSRSSLGAVVRRLFTSEAMRAPLVTTGPAVWGLVPDHPGTGLGALGYAVRHLAGVGRPVGGSGALTDALARAVEHAGGTVRTGSRVDRLLVERDRAVGVGLAGGSELRAPIVVAAIDPRHALVHWLGDDVPAAALPLEQRWRARPTLDGYQSKVDAVLDARPVYQAFEDGSAADLGVDDPLVPTAVVSPTLSEITAAHAAMGRGQVVERPMFFANVPTAADRAMVPAAGGDVLSLEVLFTPFALAGGWERTAEPERWLAVYSTLLRSDVRDSVRDWRVMTPPALEAELSLDRGFVPSFSGSTLAAVAGRRDRELTRYETPVAGLYLTGAGTFPGAGVWGASGRNTARVVLRRWRRRR